MEFDASEIDPKPQLLARELARAVCDESVPSLLRTLLKTAQVELQAWHEGASARGLAVARYALAEWRRWRANAPRA